MQQNVLLWYQPKSPSGSEGVHLIKGEHLDQLSRTRGVADAGGEWRPVTGVIGGLLGLLAVVPLQSLSW
mgnify:CR=1 FL=1